jgi:hypothetical protein
MSSISINPVARAPWLLRLRILRSFIKTNNADDQQHIGATVGPSPAQPRILPALELSLKQVRQLDASDSYFQRHVSVEHEQA